MLAEICRQFVNCSHFCLEVIPPCSDDELCAVVSYFFSPINVIALGNSFLLPLKQELRAYLTQHGGKTILEEYDKFGSVCAENRQDFVNILYAFADYKNYLKSRADIEMVCRAAVQIIPYFKVEKSNCGGIVCIYWA